MQSPILFLPLLAASSAPLAMAQGGGRPNDRPFPPMGEIRSIDGLNNHLTETERGAALTPFRRIASVAYEDGVSSPSGAALPSARFISNGLFDQPDGLPAAESISDMFWQWGQFLDHDITETPVHEPAEHFPIAVPAGDLWFDPFGSGTVEIPMSRSFPVRKGGVREQVNAITAWIDGSQIYGSDHRRAEALRAMDGTGKLASSAGNLLPFNTDGLHNAPSDALDTFFLAGDVRANEQVGLTAMHTLFMREHNYWAERIAAEDLAWRERQLGGPGGGQGNGGGGGGRRLTDADFERGIAPALTGDEIYEIARAIVSAELQVITYREWLPILLGAGAPGLDSVYREELDGSISNEFATAGFRIGHTMLSSTLLRLDDRGRMIPEGHLSLSDAFFAPQEIIATGIDPVLRGLVSQRAQAIDVYLVDDIRNLLFGPPGSGGLDLGSLNLQRGRDHGLPTYAQVRRDLGLGAPLALGEISSDPSILEGLARVARSPEGLDLWSGGIAEDPVAGGLVGETFNVILSEQFLALRDGDRLWYSRQLPRRLVDLVEGQSLSRVLMRNTGVRPPFSSEPFSAL